jgi:uncharacterized membrane protein
MWWSDFWPMPWMFFGPLFMIFFIGLCVAMMVFMMRGMCRRHGGDAIEILRGRYARGEINRD